MVHADYIEVVEQARTGDAGSFEALVKQFEAMGIATAFSWLGDIELARDATQEAFLDAHLHLIQLKSAIAFPGWFRRIVLKHCDRITRRKQLAVSSLEGIGEIRSDDPTPVASLLQSEQYEQLRHAIESLPGDQRVIVALHYFAEASGNQISEFLELPLSTVKKRLRDARSKLRQENNMTNVKSAASLKQSHSNEINFFIAIRQGDHEQAARMINEHPTLVDAQQNWDRDLVYKGVLPFATRATAIITAVEVDDLDVLRLLLDAGADVDGLCGCATAEPPLWTAALLNRQNHVEMLLDRGANPNLKSASGNTALHVAAMRGFSEIARLLLAHGADPGLKDTDSSAAIPVSAGSVNKVGKTAADWASINDHAEVQKLLRVEGTEGKGQSRKGQSQPEPSQPELSQPEPSQPELSRKDIIHTGIKAVDFFTPLIKGGLIRLPFKAGVGMVVLLGELSSRIASMENSAVIWTGFLQPPFDLRDWEADQAEFGLGEFIQSEFVSFNESAERQREAYKRGLTMIETLRKDGRDVLAVVLTSEGFESDVEETYLRLGSTQNAKKPGSVTTIVMTPFRDAEQSWTSLRAPFMAQLSLDRIRATKYIYPAINPLLSLSKSLEEVQSDNRHGQLYREVRELFAWYAALDPDLDLLSESISDNDVLSENAEKVVKVRKLLNFFSQRFAITEPFTGLEGEIVSWDELIAGLEEILKSG